ncbi:MAG: cold-shock protein [Lachnospiraceae bacterium]|nr:cold-shock protein [Lachnospiraceae bacterium]MBR5583843.1 cold-shock protein [Lachnospiraceae bacterium]
MSKGTVKWFNNQKGYGFISDEEGNDVFVHYTGLNMEGFKTLEEGQDVEYELINGAKGPQAINVIKL